MSQDATAQKINSLDDFDPRKILAEYESVQARTPENQRMLSNILRRDPSVENFSDVYSIVQRLLEAERGDSNMSTAGRPDNPYIRFVVKQIPKGSLGLEVGCAQGRLTEFLVGEGFSMVGIDSSRDAIVTAVERSRGTDWGEKCDFFATDARDLKDFKTDFFDFAMSTEVVEHLGIPGFVLHLDQLKRVLKPGGRYFLTCPSALISGTEGDLHIRMYYYREMCQLGRMLGFDTQLIFGYRNKLHVLLPRVLNPLIRLYESTLRATRLNLLFNRLGIIFLCLPMTIVFTKRHGLEDIRPKRQQLVSKGYYRD